VRLHDVRHGVATTLLERGVHPAIASAVLGHSSPAFTMGTYQHVLDGMTEVAAEALAAAFADLQSRPETSG
jgi:integrase